MKPNQLIFRKSTRSFKVDVGADSREIGFALYEEMMHPNDPADIHRDVDDVDHVGACLLAEEGPQL
jgi:hypothetical protein